VKVKKTYRLDENTLSELDELATSQGVAATVALERAIHAAAEASGKAKREPDERRQARAELSALTRQLDAKDKQIAALLDQLAAAQEVSAAVAETAKAAQALHAATVGELAPTGEKGGRWARLKAAWKG
jgi:septal ring factor EnvC (AmiA/AmiB activator)